MVVTLVSVDEVGDTFMQVVETDSLYGAVRIVVSTQAKRGRKLIKYVIEEREMLV